MKRCIWCERSQYSCRNQSLVHALHPCKRRIMKIVVSGIPIDNLDPNRLFLWLDRGIKKAVLVMEWTAKRETPVNIGNLRNSFRSRFSNLSWELYNTSLYAPYVHEWRKPGGRMPPLSAIQFWVNRKGIQAPVFLIARSIAKKWTVANPFMTRTVEKEEKNVEAIIISELKKLYS